MRRNEELMEFRNEQVCKVSDTGTGLGITRCGCFNMTVVKILFLTGFVTVCLLQCNGKYVFSIRSFVLKCARQLSG